ncbi:hypothetical protein CPB84DRAFT_1793654 [Gymnopilus junonius]|uniref:Uncharacterized protein n=1 Tax=Gymnopilus junonius TaxID=109634 RepID=A0A9P5NEP6_GYMJU|nr:hypothetical protein CPB84DRAFT_1793654 [Gymnopilus junonius]
MASLSATESIQPLSTKVNVPVNLNRPVVVNIDVMSPDAAVEIHDALIGHPAPSYPSPNHRSHSQTKPVSKGVLVTSDMNEVSPVEDSNTEWGLNNGMPFTVSSVHRISTTLSGDEGNGERVSVLAIVNLEGTSSTSAVYMVVIRALA